MSYKIVLTDDHRNSDIALYGAVSDFVNCRDPEAIIAGPADTGKTIGALSKLHICACQYPGSSLVICRKILSSTYSTVMQTYINKVLARLQAMTVTAYGGNKPEWFDYANGSRIWVAGMDKSSKILSAEHDIIYVNQAEELGLPDWEILTTRTTGRAGNMPYSQTIGDCNPAAPTHWIMSRAASGVLTRFDSSHRDNPELYNQDTGEITEAGQKRLAALENLTGSRKQRLFYGRWAAEEGAIYEIFDEEKHKVKSFVPDRTWPRVVGVDPVGAYVGALWCAFDPAGKVLNIYREYCEPFGVTTAQHCKDILKASRNEPIFAWYGGGPSERQQRADYQGHGIPLIASSVTDVWAGIDKVIELLRDDALVIHDSCPITLSEIGSYKRKVTRGIVTDTIENKNDYHMLDCLRYLVTGLIGPGEQEQVSYNPVRVGVW